MIKITDLFSGTLRKIGVLGRSGRRAEYQDLIALIDSCDKKNSLQIDFYDTADLPPDVIAALARVLDREVSLKIVAYHFSLGPSLMRLNLPVSQVNTKSLCNAIAECHALVLAGSANSLDKIEYIVEQLPLAKIAVFIVQHVSENTLNILDQLLRVRTNYQVLMPQHLVAITAGTIYIAPPGHHMKVAHGLVYLTRDPKIQFARPSIDVLFESIAMEYENNAVAVLLCGFGADGVKGCQMLKAKGACVIIENPDECGDAQVLPAAAKNSKQFDCIFPLESIVSVVAAAVGGAGVKPLGNLLDLFLNALRRQYDFDFSGYQQDSLARRISCLMSMLGFANFVDFQIEILRDQSLFERFMSSFPVGVSEFFRHPEQFRSLRDDVLELLDSFPIIKIWSSGCSSGEEPYSLAIVLFELGLLKKTRLFATDFNLQSLQMAQAGLFPLSRLELNRKNYLMSGGCLSFDAYVQLGKQYITMNPSICESTLFHLHSLTSAGSFNEFQLIVCRNVLIYFKSEMQAQILLRFAQSLHRDGFLVLGPQDGVTHLARKSGFVPYIQGSHIYKLSKESAGER
jgi:chemotaxis protein methyltransferase CheR